MSKDLTVAFIGSGNLGVSMIQGLLNKGTYNIIATDVNEQRLEPLKKLGVLTCSDNERAIAQSKVILLCTTPLQMKSLLPTISKLVKGKIIISVAAGIAISYLEKNLPGAAIMRAMPTIGGPVNESTMGFAAGASASPPDVETSLRILNDIGKTFEVDDSLIDYVTAVSASGIAFIFDCFDGLASGGVKVGLKRDLAVKLVAHTALGASKLILEQGKEPSELKNFVTTAGGTTIAGLYEMEKQGVRYGLMAAVEAAAKRAKELTASLAN